jgi:uncharacterized membrane protein
MRPLCLPVSYSAREINTGNRGRPGGDQTAGRIAPFQSCSIIEKEKLMTQKPIVAAAIAGLFALAAGSAMAQDLKPGQEKCWGVAKAGQNDCGSNKTAHSCAGQSTKNYDPNDFKVVKAGTCQKMGGSLTQGEPGRLAKEKKS